MEAANNENFKDRLIEQLGPHRGYSWSERAAELVSEEVSESSEKIRF